MALLATPDKFTRTAAHVFVAISDIDTVITTDDAPGHIVAELELHGPQVVTVRRS